MRWLNLISCVAPTGIWSGDGLSFSALEPGIPILRRIRPPCCGDRKFHAEILLKATKVDGVYDADPVKETSAKMLKRISYMEVLEKQLKVMDMTAISLAMDNQLPLAVFKLKDKGNIRRVICGEDVGTLINH